MFTAFQMFTKNINESKIFAGIVIILLNIGGKYIPVTLNRSTETLLKSKLSKDIIVFAMAWMGTRDVTIAFFLTLLFVFLTEYILNYDSPLCVIPKKDRQLPIDEEPVTDEDVTNAIAVLEKYKAHKNIKRQHETYLKYFNY